MTTKNTFNKNMLAEWEEALRINADMTAKAQTENAVLRAALAKIGGFANTWAAQYEHIRRRGPDGAWANVIGQFNTIEKTCKSALDEKQVSDVPLTYVEVGGATFGGIVIDENPMPDYPDWVEIEVADIDPTAGKMSVVGPLAGAG